MIMPQTGIHAVLTRPTALACPQTLSSHGTAGERAVTPARPPRFCRVFPVPRRPGTLTARPLAERARRVLPPGGGEMVIPVTP